MSRSWWPVLALVACDGGSTAPPPAFTPSHVVVDGISLGDPIASLATRAPYDKPCSDRSVEGGLYRALAYCHDPMAIVIADRTGAIRELGWIGGTYFADKVALPIKLGDPVMRAVAVWGEPHDSFDLGTLHVDRFDDTFSVLSDHRTIVGFVIGDMPMVATAERWRVFDELGSSAGR
ncbi:MAG TPA: hypothetical protein VGO00_26510 [Kofleriaceae bacterium]|jgi:hypothetical protein|nr:hypothetical protein [Kofleriaceae bacterium]